MLHEKLSRTTTVIQAAIASAIKQIRKETRFAASIEVTDRCNAGCHYCYVYPQEWDQHQRVRGYLQLGPQEQNQKEQQVLQTLNRLKEQGVIHVSLVGGEPALAPRLLQKAAELFPVVWIVSNGAARLPKLPRSAVIFVSIDGPPEHHNQSRDPLGFFAKHRYGKLTGMSAAIARNINESERGAYVHITLPPNMIAHFPRTVDWLVQDIKKLRGIVVSGTATKDKADSATYSPADRHKLKVLINQQAKKYGWKLFPFNQPYVNSLMFDEIVHRAADCPVAQHVQSLDFDGKSTGKCVMRNETLCDTCLCNITGLGRAVNHLHMPTIAGVIQASFG